MHQLNDVNFKDVLVQLSALSLSIILTVLMPISVVYAEVSGANRCVLVFELELAQIDSRDLDAIRSVDNEYELSTHIKRATYQGKPVFLKLMSERELTFARKLSLLGYGPRILGETVISGEAFVVTAFVEGRLFKGPWPYPEWSPKQKRQIDQDIQDQLAVLAEHGITVGDFQLLITPKGKISFIDPEWYRFESTSEASRVNSRAYQHYRVNLLAF